MENPLFLKEFVEMTDRMEKKLHNPDLPFEERKRLTNEITSLKIQWQKSGAGDINVIIKMRDSVAGLLKTGVQMGFDQESFDAMFSEEKKSLTKLNKIIAEARQKGLIE